MSIKIRKIECFDKEEVVEMMNEFYSSDAVSTNGSSEIFNVDVDNCISENPYVEGYVFDNCGVIQGYAMLAKSFSTEFGKQCIWIEDIFIRKEFRGFGLGSLFLKFIEEKYSQAMFRLDVEEENKRAVEIYKKNGYDILPYMEMKKI